MQTESESVATLHSILVACRYTTGEEVFEWIAKLDAIYTQFKVAGKEVVTTSLFFPIRIDGDDYDIKNAIHNSISGS